MFFSIVIQREREGEEEKKQNTKATAVSAYLAPAHSPTLINNNNI